MSNLIPLMGRATDDTLTLVTNAVAYFYEEGTLTPLTVYTDETLATPRGTSVAADSEGVFPQCWTSVSQIKVDVKDGSGVSLPGFPQDDFPTLALGGQTASDITATPATGNSGTTAQAQLNNNTGRINRLDNAPAVTVSAGSSGAYTLTSTFTITAYAVRQEYEFIANHDNVGGGSDTLNVDSVGAVVLKKYDGSTSKADLVAGEISTGDTVNVRYDGTHFVAKIVRHVASEAEALAGTDNTKIMTPLRVAQVSGAVTNSTSTTNNKVWDISASGATQGTLSAANVNVTIIGGLIHVMGSVTLSAVLNTGAAEEIGLTIDGLTYTAKFLAGTAAIRDVTAVTAGLANGITVYHACAPFGARTAGQFSASLDDQIRIIGSGSLGLAASDEIYFNCWFLA